MESSEQNRSSISKTICPTMLVFWQVGLSDVVLSKYPNKSHNLRKFNFYDTCHHFRTLCVRVLANLLHRQNDTQAKSICKTAPKSLFWIPTCHCHFVDLPIRMKGNLKCTTVGDMENISQHCFADFTNHG